MMYSSQRMPYCRDSMPEKVKALNNQEELAGFMFMFDHLKMPVCFQFGVLELPELRKEVLKKIRPGMYLFFYDILAMFLYGIYTTTSSVKLRIEESASGRKFSAQVEFQLLQDYVPLTGRMIKHVIQDNFHKEDQKFSPELNLGQVKSLLSMFISDPINKLISMPTSAPELSMQYQTSKSQLHLPARPLGVRNTYSAGNSGSFGESVPEPQPTYQNMPYQYYQPEHRSLMNMGDTIYGPSSQSSLLAHQIHLSPQTNPSFSLLSFAGIYDEPLADPQHTYILNPQSNFHSSTVNMSSSQAQSISDPQYVNQNVLNPQPNFNPYVDVGYANPIMQSHAPSSSSVPYYSDQTGYEHIPEAVNSAAYPYQGSSVLAGTSSEAAEGIMHGQHGDQQTGIGNECCGSSLQAWTDINHQQ